MGGELRCEVVRGSQWAGSWGVKGSKWVGGGGELGCEEVRGSQRGGVGV